MFTITKVPAGSCVLEYRKDTVSGLRCRIAADRLRRGLSDLPWTHGAETTACPFCPENIARETPTFPDGSRFIVGDSVTFPNLFPFAECHIVTVITRRHAVDRFTVREVGDAVHGQVSSLQAFRGFPSINWNYLPSAGASLAHPHFQGIADRNPPPIVERYLEGGSRYVSRTGSSYWTDLEQGERASERFLFGDEISWFANPVPLGEREVRGILPIRTIHEFEPYIDPFVRGLLTILDFYRTLGTRAFNASLFFNRRRDSREFRAFCSVIARINPNNASLSDSAFMERLHGEPVILTLPEDLGKTFRTQFEPLIRS